MDYSHEIDHLQQQIYELKSNIYQLQTTQDSANQTLDCLKNQIMDTEYSTQQNVLFNERVNQTYLNQAAINISINERLDFIQQNLSQVNSMLQISNDSIPLQQTESIKDLPQNLLDEANNNFVDYIVNLVIEKLNKVEINNPLYQKIFALEKLINKILPHVNDINFVPQEMNTDNESANNESAKNISDELQENINSLIINATNNVEKKLKNSIKHQISSIDKRVHNLNSYLDNVDDTMDYYDKAFKEISNDNELLLTAFINLKQNFDTYVNLQTKEKIMNTAIITVLTIELLANRIIDGQHYSKMIKDIVNQILATYKKAGYEIDFSQELQALDISMNNGNTNITAIHIPPLVNIQSGKPSSNYKEKNNTNVNTAINNMANGLVIDPVATDPIKNDENAEVDKNIIDFNSILNSQNKSSAALDEVAKNKLYNLFNEKINDALKDHIPSEKSKQSSTEKKAKKSSKKSKSDNDNEGKNQ